MKKEYAKDILEDMGKKFPDIEVKVHSPRRTYITLVRDQVYDLARYLFMEKHFRFSIATGIDTRTGIEIIYHFSHDQAGTFYSIKTSIPKDDPTIKSLVDFLPAANWIEREIFELLGVTFVGHPNLKPLLTPETWPPDLYPLRRDYREEHKDMDRTQEPA
jgi:NADH:ubiquinone oxidoreductase subunit C